MRTKGFEAWAQTVQLPHSGMVGTFRQQTGLNPEFQISPMSCIEWRCRGHSTNCFDLLLLYQMSRESRHSFCVQKLPGSPWTHFSVYKPGRWLLQGVDRYVTALPMKTERVSVYQEGHLQTLLSSSNRDGLCFSWALGSVDSKCAAHWE